MVLPSATKSETFSLSSVTVFNGSQIPLLSMPNGPPLPPPNHELLNVLTTNSHRTSSPFELDEHPPRWIHCAAVSRSSSQTHHKLPEHRIRHVFSMVLTTSVTHRRASRRSKESGVAATPQKYYAHPLKMREEDHVPGTPSTRWRASLKRTSTFLPYGMWISQHGSKTYQVHQQRPPTPLYELGSDEKGLLTHSSKEYRERSDTTMPASPAPSL